MAVNNILDVNFPQAISKIRQANLAIPVDDWAVYYLKSGQTGLTLDDLVWQVVGLAKPSEQEMIDAYNNWLANEQVEINELEQDKQDVVDEVDAYNLARSDYVLAFKLINTLGRSFANGLNPDADTVYSAFVSQLNGTSLETGIKNFVTMSSGLTDFGLGISLAEKRQIMENAIDYLQVMCIVGEIKAILKE